MKEIQKIKLSEIIEEEDRWNRPLEAPDGPEMAVLVASMAHNGQLMPIVVRPVAAGKWRVVMGHRRVRAAKKLKWKEMEAVVQEMDEEQAQGDAFAENYARKGVSVYWEAEEVRRLLSKGSTPAQVAAMLGRSVGWVKRRQRFDLDACRRFKKEVLDPLGISMDEVHPTNLELLGECPEEAWEDFQVMGKQNEDFRQSIGGRDWLASYLRREFQRVIGRSWSEACQDPESGESFPACSGCEHVNDSLKSLFPELDKYALGWDKGQCARKACMERKKAAWRKSAERDARAKHGKLRVLTAEELEEGDWCKCKPTHPAARLAIYDGDRSGEWAVVRPLKEVTGKAEPEKEEAWQVSEQKRAEHEQLWKRMDANRHNMAAWLDKMKERLGEGRETRDPNLQVVRDALCGYADLLKLSLDYEDPEDEEFAAMVKGLARAVLTGKEHDDAAATVAEWVELNVLED